MSQTPLCIVRGSINIDEFFHVPFIVVPGETLSSTKFERRSGGKGANQAVAVARAGGDVALVGAVGEDGGWVVEGLSRVSVDVGGVHVVQDEPTGRAIIQLTPEGENSIILHRGANYSTISDTWRDTPYTHLLLQNEIPYESTLAALQAAHASGAVTVFNPSPMPDPSQLRSFPWTQLDWLIINQGEAKSLLHVFPPSGNHNCDLDPSSTSLLDPVVAEAFGVLQTLRDHPSFSPSVNIVCTLGAEGVLALARGHDSPLYIPAARLEGPVVDTTGAGDCFTGYLVAELMSQSSRGIQDGRVLEALLRTAVQAAGLCVQVSGATESIPSMSEVVKASKA